MIVTVGSVARSARSRVTAAIELAGLAGIVWGVSMVYVPAAFVVGGLGAVIWAQGSRGGLK